MTKALHSGYHGVMASELTQTEDATTIDLTGLPEPVVQQARRREELADKLSAVGRFPTAMTVRAKFTVVGRLQPLPLPDLDDSP